MQTARTPGSIAFSRHAIARTLWLVAVAAGLPGCSDSSGPGALTVSAVAGSDGQSALTGATLPVPLGVRVQSDGAPKAGMTVTWHASAGTVVPASGVTDAAGLASTTWTLGAAAGAMSVTSTVAGAQGSPVTFNATAVTRMRATAVTATDGQTGVVGSALSLPLRVKVDSGGVPQAGATIHWLAHAGAITPIESVSDADGIASATWTLATTPGVETANASIVGNQAPSVSFSATARAGPAAAIDVAGGNAQTFPANHAPKDPLVAVVTDQYGNVVGGQAVTWTVERGPVAFLAMGGATDEAGRSVSTITGSGAPGDAVVRAALPGTAAKADFALTIAKRSFDVVLHTFGQYAFVSSQNGSSNPAVDTIPAGRTMTWTLEFDYDQHGVAPVGTPSFQGADFPYAADPVTVTVTFTTPGTYHYTDPYHTVATGIVVVQ